MAFFRNRTVQILSVALIVQAVFSYSFSRGEDSPSPPPLKTLAAEAGGWKLVEEGVVEKEVQDVLRADDTLSRVYVEQPSARVATLFVAFFKSQRTGQAPHSPKNCLPGSGWAPTDSGTISISIPGEPRPITVNRYVVSRGEQQSVVMYWYQSRGRVVASEYMAKIYLVADAIRYNRTDTALVRVTVPVTARGGIDAASQAAVEFIQTFYGPLRRQLPS